MTSADERNGSTTGDGSAPRKKGGTFNKAEYDSAYIKERIVYKRVNFNRGNPEDRILLEWIDSQKEKTAAYLRRLVLEDMLRRQGGKHE